MKNKKSSTRVTPRCQFRFSDGRRCRMLRSPDHSSFCPFHAQQELQLLESQRLGSEISATLHGDFLSATDINHVLGKLFIAVAQGRMPARRAGQLAFIGQVLLSSLPHVKQEFPFKYKFEHWKQLVCTAAPLSPPTFPPTPSLSAHTTPPLSAPAAPPTSITSATAPATSPAPPSPAGLPSATDPNSNPAPPQLPDPIAEPHDPPSREDR